MKLEPPGGAKRNHGISTDLKLLVDLAWANRNGQVEYRLAHGEYAAAERLTKRGLILNGGGGMVQMTNTGEEIVGQMCRKIDRAHAVKENPK